MSIVMIFVNTISLTMIFINGDDIFDDIYEYVNDDISESDVENARTSSSTLEKSPKPEDDRSLIFL